MEEFYKRLLEEKEQLTDKIFKLSSFIGIDKFKTLPEIQQALLQVQFQAMKTYETCLVERLKYLADV